MYRIKKTVIALLLLSAVVHICLAEERTFRVGVYDNPPKVFLNKRGKPSGIFIDVIEHIAQRENWNIEYIYGSWDTCLRYLNNGTIDIMPDVAFSESRAKIYSFNRITVLPSWVQFYTKKGNTLLSYRELDGKRIAVLSGSIQERLCRDIIDRMGLTVEFLSFSNYSGSIDSVLFNKADALIASRFLGFSDISRYLESSPLILETSTLHFASLEGKNTDILNTIDRYLISLFNDPRSDYYMSIEKWFHQEPRYFLPGYIKFLLLVISLSSVIGISGAVMFRVKLGKKTAALLESGTRLAASNERLKISIEEKDLLLRELYHRIGNNINLILSMISLKAENYSEPSIASFRKEIESRIYPLLLVNNMAYESKSLSHIDMKEYITSVMGKILTLFPETAAKIEFRILESGSVILPIDTAIPLGMVITEFLTNSLSYAFPDQRSGTIELAMTITDEKMLSLTYRDDGVGLPSKVNWSRPETLGFQLIDEITRMQLGGRIDVLNTEGLKFTLQIPFSQGFKRL